MTKICSTKTTVILLSLNSAMMLWMIFLHTNSRTCKYYKKQPSLESCSKLPVKTSLSNAEAYLEPSQTSAMEYLPVNYFREKASL